MTLARRGGLTAIVKPTHDCNLGCKYCYVGDNAEQGRMNERTLANVIEKITRFVGTESPTEFLWHGGEPLLMGIEFYRKAVELQKSLTGEYNIRNSLQTNGTLLTEEFADFFLQNNFRIGFSLDGLPEQHNRTRPYADESNSFEDVLKGYSLAKERGLGGGVIVVVTRQNIDSLPKIYSFLKENKINAKLNPLLHSGRACKNINSLAISPKEFGVAMNGLFDLWFNEKEYSIALDPFELIIGNMATTTPRGCNFAGKCQNSFISIGPLGDTYPCGQFDGEQEFYLGNINTDSMEEIDGARGRVALRGREQSSTCAPCRYVSICNGGCPHEAYLATGSINERTSYCLANKMMFQHIERAVRGEINGGSA